MHKGRSWDNIFLGISVNNNRLPYIKASQGYCAPVGASAEQTANNLFSEDPKIVIGQNSGWHLYSSSIAVSPTPGIEYNYPHHRSDYEPEIGKYILRYDPLRCFVDIDTIGCGLTVPVDSFTMKAQLEWLNGKIFQTEGIIANVEDQKEYYEQLLNSATQSNIDSVYGIIEEDSIVNPDVLEMAINNYYASQDLQGLKEALITHSGLPDETIDTLVMAQLPYSQNDIDDIQAAQDQLSAYDHVYRKLSYFNFEKTQLHHRLTSSLVDSGLLDRAIDLLEEDTSRIAQTILLNLATKHADFSRVENLNQSLFEKGWIDTTTYSTIDFFNSYYSSGISDSFPDLSPSDSLFLLAVAVNESRVMGDAAGFLEFLYDTEFPEAYPDYEESEKRSFERRDPWEGIRVVQQSGDFKVYPNPASNEVFLNFCNLSFSVTSISLVAIDGKQIRQFPNEGNDCTLSLNLEGVPTGAYIVSVLDDKSGERASEQIIVSK